MLFYAVIVIKLAPENFENGVLVGAFSVFGRADTGKPVQIFVLFWDFEAFPAN